MSLLIKIENANLGTPEVSKATPERLVEGDPTYRTWPLDEARGGEVNTGIWEATPGAHRAIKGELFEFCHILEGVAELTEEGKEPVIVRKGDSFLMKPGFKGVWKTIETVRKIYVTVG